MNPIILLKIGGNAAQDPQILKHLFAEIKKLSSSHNFLLLHGGGAEVSRVSKAFGLEPCFENGIRQTTPEEMESVEMVLSGIMNKKLVRLAGSAGLSAIGVSGCDNGIIKGSALSSSSRTGKVEKTDPDFINMLLEKNYFPVISPVSVDEDWGALNINADEAALAVSAALKADSLIFLSDIPGILKEKAVIKKLTPSQAETEITDGTISGGMIPKVRSSIQGLKEGIHQVIIGQFLKSGDLESLLEHEIGSSLVLEESIN